MNGGVDYNKRMQSSITVTLDDVHYGDNLAGSVSVVIFELQDEAFSGRVLPDGTVSQSQISCSRDSDAKVFRKQFSALLKQSHMGSVPNPSLENSLSRLRLL